MYALCHKRRSGRAVVGWIADFVTREVDGLLVHSHDSGILQETIGRVFTGPSLRHNSVRAGQQKLCQSIQVFQIVRSSQ